MRWFNPGTSLAEPARVKVDYSTVDHVLEQPHLRWISQPTSLVEVERVGLKRKAGADRLCGGHWTEGLAELLYGWLLGRSVSQRPPCRS